MDHRIARRYALEIGEMKHALGLVVADVQPARFCRGKCEGNDARSGGGDGDGVIGDELVRLVALVVDRTRHRVVGEIERRTVRRNRRDDVVIVALYDRLSDVEDVDRDVTPPVAELSIASAELHGRGGRSGSLDRGIR